MNTPISTSANSQSMRVRLCFDQTRDDHLLVLAEILSPNPTEATSRVSVQTFLNENIFLAMIIEADLAMEDTALLAGTVIRSFDRSLIGRSWIELPLTLDQIGVLGLDGRRLTDRPVATQASPAIIETAFGFADDPSQFYAFLMQSPTPFVMLSGPEHRFTFINQPYVDLIGKTTREEILMKTVREVLPELEGQPFFEWLDDVYERGVRYTKKDQLAHMRSQLGGGFEDRFFDFSYYPIRDARGQVYGVMIQAAEVTEKVHIEAISERREEALFRQWAEIDAIYRTAPVGIAVIEPKSLRLLRVNDKQAEMLGSQAVDVVGRRTCDLDWPSPAMTKLFERAEAGETVLNAIVDGHQVADSSNIRFWLVNISPFRGASGEMLAFVAASLEMTAEYQPVQIGA